MKSQSATTHPGEGAQKTPVAQEIFRIISLEASAAPATTAGGKRLPRTRLTLQNAHHASLQAVDWNNALTLKTGDVIKVSGSLKEYKGQPQLSVTTVERLETFDPSALLPCYPGDLAALESRLASVIKSIPDQRLSALAERLLDPDSELGKRFRLAPAAPVALGHEPYIHGLLQHLTEVAETARLLALKAMELRPTEYGQVNLSTVIFGALLHDLGKTSAYEYGAEGIKFSPAGRLNGHLIESYRLIANALHESKQFSQAEIDNILHLIASHHGPDSDQPPRTIEAWIVHSADCFCSKLGSTFGYPHTPSTV